MPPHDFESFAKLIAGLLKADPIQVTPAATASDFAGWDSVQHAIIILTIEESYGIMFTDDEVMNTPDVGTLYERAMAHLNATSGV